MRQIDFIAIHCSDSGQKIHDCIEVIESWHLERNFKKIGYHYVITQDGNIHKGREDHEVGAHIKGHNKNSIAICLTGDKKFTAKQFQALKNLCQKLCKEYGLTKLDILPHNNFDPLKTCPNFPLEEIVATWEWV